MITLISQVDQLNLEKIIQNFQKLDKTYCDRLFCEKNGKTLYGSITHFIGSINNTKIKQITFDFFRFLILIPVFKITLNLYQLVVR